MNKDENQMDFVGHIVNLEDAQHSSETKASRMSVGTDENDDIQLRSNNSFLHDNVD